MPTQAFQLPARYFKTYPGSSRHRRESSGAEASARGARASDAEPPVVGVDDGDRARDERLVQGRCRAQPTATRNSRKRKREAEEAGQTFVSGSRIKTVWWLDCEVVGSIFIAGTPQSFA